VATLTPWGPSDAHAVPLVELLTRAEAGVLAVLRDELREDGLASGDLALDGCSAFGHEVRASGLCGFDLGACPRDGVVDNRVGRFLEGSDEWLVQPERHPQLVDQGHAVRVDRALLDVVQRASLSDDGLQLFGGENLGGFSGVGHRLDSITSALSRVRSVLDRLLGNATISRVVTDSGERAREASERQWAEQVSRELGQRVALDTGPGRERLQAWIAENTARIQGLRNATLEQVRADLETAVLSQVRPSELAAHWERVGLPTRNGTLRGRGLVIARDQLGTLASQLAQEQQQALGVEEYDWDATFEVTRKHRAVHRGRHGARYRWDAPPPDGHPGRAVCCGCKPRAVVDRATLRKRFGGRA
jgi:hypothetical protein